MIKTIIQSTLLEFNIEFILNELAEENMKRLSTLKLRIIDKLLRRLAYLNDEHLILIYRFSKVILGKTNLNNMIINYPCNNDSRINIKNNNKNEDLGGNYKDKKNDSNLSLNSTPNSKIENNSDWGIEEKCQKKNS